MSMRISTDKSELDLDVIHEYISNQSYWGRGRTVEQVQRTVDNSLCFGGYVEGKQVCFGRVVTDKTVFAYLMDIIVFDPFQGRGYGKELLRYIMEHDAIRNASTVALKTKDAHGFYEAYGFKSIGDSSLWMARDTLSLL
ncbi:GNAT family N-acetyltransferase [Poritiphilus flavus]|uniref:GNAT family N-acetyltransferase n=1 Tax=Poritiphilus flavus TaxID=2697053 RepID=A0A6L9EG56_9FLAO|nr:GNAT family N-acetyltransferase [Poritiphilus flavus]NAS13622.1 GNAT family N-acetyltransferase [Poritiphilus flavus]